MNIKNFVKFIFLFLFQMLFADVIIVILTLFGINLKGLPFNSLIGISLLCNLLVLFVICLVYRKTIISDIKDYFKNFKEYFPFSIKCWLVGFALMIIVNLIIFYFLGDMSQNEEEIQNILTAAPLYMFFSSVIYAPLVEELIFRKSISDFINNKYVYIIVSGLVFGFIHTTAGLFTSDGGLNLSEMVYIIPYGVVGSCFAYLYSKTDNIFCSIFMHAFHNLFAFAVSLMPLVFEVIL